MPDDTQPQNSGSGKRILIVEDERPLSHALQLKLAHEGYDVVVAEDGEAGLKRATEEQPFDLVLVDVIMPKMDGFTMLSMLREAGQNPHIVILSNLGQPEDLEKAKSLGVSKYLVKSNTPISKIVDMVHSIFDA